MAISALSTSGLKGFLMSSGQDNVKKMWFNLGTQMAEFMGMEVTGTLAGVSLVPDMLIGWLPLYTVQNVDSAVSNKQLRFRSFGGHLLSFQKGENESLIITLKLVGKYALHWLSILEYYYLKGEPRPTTREIPTYSGLNVIREGIPVPQFGTASGGIFSTVFTVPTTQTGAPITSVEQLTQTSDVVLNQERVISQTPTLRVNNPLDYEILWRHKTFNVLTKHKVWVRMYIETMTTRKSVDMGLDEYEVSMLVRKYTDPPKKIYVKTTDVHAYKAMDQLGITSKDDALKRLKELEAKGVQDAQKEYNWLKKSKVSRPRSIARFNKIKVRLWWKEDKDKTRLFTIPQNITGMDFGTQEWTANVLWRVGWSANDILKNPGLVTQDPLVSKIQLIARSIVNAQGSTRRTYATDKTFASLGGKRRDYSSAQFTTTGGARRGYIGDPVFTMGQTVVKVDAAIGEQRSISSVTREADFLAGLGIVEIGKYDIEDYFTVIPQQKQADFENCCLLGATIREVEGAIEGTGRLVFDFPFDFYIEVTRSTDPFSDPVTIKLVTGNFLQVLTPGLVFFMGSSDKAIWDIGKTQDDNGNEITVNYVKKRRESEVYLYIEKVEESENTTFIKAMFIHPTYGI